MMDGLIECSLACEYLRILKGALGAAGDRNVILLLIGTEGAFNEAEFHLRPLNLSLCMNGQ